ncbi:Hypothetical_protein [Hexamita inflata]|uniref:Hypothetical_protein n=1 Tax=Hexamita inflata TaxID=28002 RepID=A0AA86NZ22_9EUKA|nr:Hypothetical protein HINF_LOCUS16309 [Hexamita inflata]
MNRRINLICYNQHKYSDLIFNRNFYINICQIKVGSDTTVGSHSRGGSTQLDSDTAQLISNDGAYTGMPNKLSSWAIVLIVIGSIAGAALLVSTICWCVKHKREQPQQQPNVVQTVPAVQQRHDNGGRTL